MRFHFRTSCKCLFIYSVRATPLLLSVKSPAQRFTFDSSLVTLFRTRDIQIHAASHSSLLNTIHRLCSEIKLKAKICVRFLTLIAIYTPIISLFPLWLALNWRSIAKGLPPNTWWISLLVSAFDKSGPTFIKLGQYASSRTDIFPTYACEILAKLQDQVSPQPFSLIQHVIRTEFPQITFLSLDSSPLGVGAIAQVHRAQITDPATGNTHDVAIKVITPSAKPIITMDLKIISAFAWIIHTFIPGAKWISLTDEVRVFGDMMRAQLDLRNEGTNLEIFRNNFENDGVHNVLFPTPILKSENVLIETYVPGMPINDVFGSVFDKEMGKIGLDSFLRMLIFHNFVHADLHPGNIHVVFLKPRTIWDKILGIKPEVDSEICATLKDSDSGKIHEKLKVLKKSGYKPALAMLDAGLVSTLSPTNFRNFLDLFQAVTDFNGLKVGYLMITRSKTPESAISPHEFMSEMQSLVKSVQKQTLSLSKIRLGDLLASVLRLVRQYHVRLEGDFVNVAVSIMLLEGVGRKLDPDLDLLKESVPMLEMAAKKNVWDGSWEGTLETTKFWTKAWVSRILAVLSKLRRENED